MEIGPSCYWDKQMNTSVGCDPVDTGCDGCYAAALAFNLLRHDPFYEGVVGLTDDGRPAFNGRTKVRPPGHPIWTLPLRHPGVVRPRLGPGKPSIIFVGNMSDVGYRQPTWVFDKIADAFAGSPYNHIGLLLTRRPGRLRAYFTAPRSLTTLRRQQEVLWLGCSAPTQDTFDQRWPHLRALAERGWFVFVSLAPLLEPIRLPPDLLALGDRVWVIVAGEEGAHADCRPMDPDWARALRDQCAQAHIPFFFKQMAAEAPIPVDLMVREFPVWPRPSKE